MVPGISPHVWLVPRWYAWLEFGPDSQHATFIAIGDRVAQDLGGRLVEVLPNSNDEGKEYAEIVVGEARLLLMRKERHSIALGTSCRDLPLLLQLAASVQAEYRGWRWPIYRLWRRVMPGRPKVKPAS